jgi:hypothetical protein
MNTEAIKTNDETPPAIAPETLMIDIISHYRQTEAIFKHLEEKTGTCVLCEGLFLSLKDAARQFGFDLGDVLGNLRSAIGPEDGCIRPSDSTRL